MMIVSFLLSLPEHCCFPHSKEEREVVPYVSSLLRTEERGAVLWSSRLSHYLWSGLPSCMLIGVSAAQLLKQALCYGARVGGRRCPEYLDPCHSPGKSRCSSGFLALACPRPDRSSLLREWIIGWKISSDPTLPHHSTFQKSVSVSLQKAKTRKQKVEWAIWFKREEERNTFPCGNGECDEASLVCKQNMSV